MKEEIPTKDYMQDGWDSGPLVAITTSVVAVIIK
jgi:hypothetical protein